MLLAIPSLSRRRRQIVESIQQLGITSLRPIASEELLGRDAVPRDPALLGPGVARAVVCVPVLAVRLAVSCAGRFSSWSPRSWCQCWAMPRKRPWCSMR